MDDAMINLLMIMSPAIIGLVIIAIYVVRTINQGIIYFTPCNIAGAFAKRQSGYLRRYYTLHTQVAREGLE